MTGCKGSAALIRFYREECAKLDDSNAIIKALYLHTVHLTREYDRRCALRAFSEVVCASLATTLRSDLFANSRQPILIVHQAVLPPHTHCCALFVSYLLSSHAGSGVRP